MTLPRRSVWRVTSAVGLVLVVGGCAAKRVALPSGAGTPFPGFAAAHEQAVSDCREVKTLTASLGLSGRAGQTKLRGHIDAGFAAPASVRLEGFPPLSFGGRPVFILVARANDATLVLPRDRRVLRGAPPAAIVEALSGVPLGPGELRLAIAGCGLTSADASAGRTYGNGWSAVDVGGATAFLRQIDGRWRVVAATRESLTLEYSDFASGRPGTVRLRTAPSNGGSDVILRLSQVELNAPLEPAVFEVEVPRDADPMTLEELRRAGPLGGT
jgi:hypothetical protein